MIIRRHMEDGSIIDPCVVLLEVNDRVGYKSGKSQPFMQLQDDFLDWVWKNGYAFTTSD